MSTEGNFACLFDVDGVIAKGPNVIPAAKTAIQKLNEANVPFIFVTNTCAIESEKAEQLSSMLDLPITTEQVVLAHSPMRCLSEYHNKHVLICGQGPIKEIARLVGFNDTTTIEQLCEDFPELDMVDHSHRSHLSELLKTKGIVHPINFRPIEAVVLLGEPIHWETSLQIITDILLTNGDPGETSTEKKSSGQIPVIACNKDLVFKAFATLPRFGHGAFLTCLEALYKELSGEDLVYTALVGKPYEISFQYAEMMANKLARSKGQQKIDRMYFVGDNPDVDIVGANVYNSFLQRNPNGRRGSLTGCGLLVHPRLLSAKSCESILVCTGVYDPSIHKINTKQTWARPTTIQLDALDAVTYCLKKEQLI